MHKHIQYTDAAVTDLDLIFSYISDANREAAERMLNRIEAGILRIAQMPYIGSVIPSNSLSLVEPGYRMLVIEPYIVFYRVAEDAVIIGRILHSRQDWLQLVFDEGQP